MTRTIVVTSGEEGVGKTNFALNTALELAKRQYLTCLLDGDVGFNNVNILLNLKPELTFANYLFEDKSLSEIILKTASGLHIIPGGSGIENITNLAPKKINRLIKDMISLDGYDFFIIDTSSGISRNVVSLCLAATETILVLTPDSHSLAHSYSMLKTLAGNNYRGLVKILVSKCSNVNQAKRAYLHFKKVATKHLDIKIAPAGIILQDFRIDLASSRKEPVLTAYPDAAASKCIRALVSYLTKPSSKPKEKQNFGTFWTHYFKYMQTVLKLPEKSPVPPFEIDPLKKSSYLKARKRHRKIREGFAPQHMPDGATLFTFGSGTTLSTPLPFLSRILSLYSSQNLTPLEMKNIVSADPVLLSKLLQLYSSTYPVEEIQDTDISFFINELGSQVVGNMLIATALEAAMIEPTSLEDHIFLINFWLHSYSSGLLARELTNAIAHPLKEEAFFAGMLHDIGRLSIQRYNPSIYSSNSSHDYHNDTVINAETALFGKSHAEIGADILKSLRVNSFIVDAARFHTTPPESMSSAFDFSKLVYLAQHATAPSSSEGDDEIFDFLSECGLSTAEFASLQKNVTSAVKRTVNKYNLEIDRDSLEDKVYKQHEQLKRQAMKHILTQSLMDPVNAPQTLPDLIRTVTQGLWHLFGIKKAICLFPDYEKNQLRASGYPGSTGHEWLSNISFKIDSSKSRVVQSFIKQKILSIKNNQKITLTDKELLSALQTSTLHCIPLAIRVYTFGIIVCEVPETNKENINTLLFGLKQFGTQTLSKITAIRKTIKL